MSQATPKLMPEDKTVMGCVLYLIDQDPTPWYTANAYAKDSFDLTKKDIIGFAVREKGKTLGVGSDDLHKFMEQVEDQAIAVRWFDRSIRSELED